jgi:probable HAF family extracellular repeat protein
MQDLGVLLPEGGLGSSASGINDAGLVVGSSGRGEYATSAFVWTLADGMQDLNALIDARDPLKATIELTSAADINNAGQIVGYGRDAINGGQRAFLLTPIPEHDDWALLLVGLSLTGIMMQRRRS